MCTPGWSTAWSRRRFEVVELVAGVQSVLRRTEVVGGVVVEVQSWPAASRRSAESGAASQKARDSA